MATSTAPGTQPKPATLVIFGASGDLSHRSLWPAIYNLMNENLLPEHFRAVGVAFDIDEATFAQEMGQTVAHRSRSGFKAEVWDKVMDRTRLLRGSFTDEKMYEQLKQTLDRCAQEIGSADVVFYLAVAPNFIAPIAAGLNRVGYGRNSDNGGRLVCEKPFGYDLATAVELNEELHKHFGERQIFRIDHYLGKETVQNLLVMRFGNSIFEPLWNRNYVESVQITVAEPEGIGTRAGYYEPAGALRDVLQNHMMQLLAFVCMEAPTYFDADSIRAEKSKVLAATHIRDIHTDVVRGQFVSGPGGRGYLQERDIPAYSKTETYVAMRLEVDNWRWAGTPFYLRTGKRLPRKMAEIAVRFKPAPHLPFVDSSHADVQPNELVITLQPDEGVSLRAVAKVPGQEMRLQSVEMQFAYSSSFNSQSPEAYERLVHAVIVGDATLFQHAAEVEAAWSIVQPVLDHWQQDSFDLYPYAAGTDGPAEAERLLDGETRWRPLTPKPE